MENASRLFLEKVVTASPESAQLSAFREEIKVPLWEVGGPRAGHSTPGQHPQDPLPGPAATLHLMQPRRRLAFWDASALGHGQFFIYHLSQVLLHRAPLKPLTTQPVFVLGIVQTQVQDIALGLVEPHEGQSPFGPSAMSATSQHTAWCHQQTCWGCAQSHCPYCWQRC